MRCHFYLEGQDVKGIDINKLVYLEKDMDDSEISILRKPQRNDYMVYFLSLKLTDVSLTKFNPLPP